MGYARPPTKSREISGHSITEGGYQMNRINTNDFANDTLIEAVRACAAQADLRVLQELELAWVGGGDGNTTPDYGLPPTP